MAVSTNNGTPTAVDDAAFAGDGNTITIDVLDNDDYGLDYQLNTQSLS